MTNAMLNHVQKNTIEGQFIITAHVIIIAKLFTAVKTSIFDFAKTSLFLSSFFLKHCWL